MYSMEVGECFEDFFMVEKYHYESDLNTYTVNFTYTYTYKMKLSKGKRLYKETTKCVISIACST